MNDEQTAFIWARWCDGLRPEPALTVSEWSDQHAVLPATSAGPGRWKTSRVPYLRDIMDALSPRSGIKRIVFMKGAQIGATQGGLNWIGYTIHNAPGTMLLVLPSLDDVQRNSRARIAPMIEECPVLRERVAPPHAKDSSNTLTHKKFPGGELVMTGATSAKGLRSTPARYLFLDEVDGYPADADEEGDPVALAIQRTVTFRGRSKVYMVSTPTIKGYSRIEKAYTESDQRIYEVPCRQCGEFARIVWANIQWPEGEPAAAFWVCPACGHPHPESAKRRLLTAGRWRATSPGDGVTAGFHLSGLYSPFETWGEIAVEHLAVRSDPVRLKAWVNLKLGETWEGEGGERPTDATVLRARREAYGDLLPPGVVVLTAAVDTQNDRLELVVIGWGADEEAWVIDYRVFWGDPSGPAVWDAVDAALLERYPHSRQVADMGISAACVDSGGHHTAAVYAFCHARTARRVYAIKGSSAGWGVPIWPAKPPKRGKHGRMPPITVGVDAAKDAIYARLKIEISGAGYIHFTDSLGDDYFDQLTSEKVFTKYVHGRPVRQYRVSKDGARNEALDTFVYSMAALHSLYAIGFRMAAHVEELRGRPLKSDEAENTPAHKAHPQRRPRFRIG